jgi:hypothetical protein
MDEIITEAANAIAAEVLMEAAHIISESKDFITIDEAIQRAVHNLAHAAHSTTH